LNEACLNLLGCDIGLSPALLCPGGAPAHAERLDGYREETGHPYNLEATPAEGATYRLARLDAERFPGIHMANSDRTSTGAAPFYTNSSHLPVNYSDDPFQCWTCRTSCSASIRGDGAALLRGRVCGGSICGEVVRADRVREVPAALSDGDADVLHLPGARVPAGRTHPLSTCGREAEVYSRIVGTCVRWPNGTRESWRSSGCGGASG